MATLFGLQELFLDLRKYAIKWKLVKLFFTEYFKKTQQNILQPSTSISKIFSGE